MRQCARKFNQNVVRLEAPPIIPCAAFDQFECKWNAIQSWYNIDKRYEIMMVNTMYASRKFSVRSKW